MQEKQTVRYIHESGVIYIYIYMFYISYKDLEGFTYLVVSWLNPH